MLHLLCTFKIECFAFYIFVFYPLILVNLYSFNIITVMKVRFLIYMYTHMSDNATCMCTCA